MEVMNFRGNHKEVSDKLKKAGFVFNKDFSYSGTLGDSAAGKKAKNYITFYNDEAKDFYLQN